MELQLELLPYHYYNTLDFDPELINYLDHVDDDMVFSKLKHLYKDGGRPPVDPRTYFRMHYLYFTYPEITSFRQLERELRKSKNQAWRNFIGTPNIEDVPAHNSLSQFRKLVGPDLFYEILFGFVAQALRLEGLIPSSLAGIDSRPIYAHVNGYKKKRCNCLDRKSCDCPATYSDPDATVGVQRNKVNQNQFFVGYRKHSIVCPTPEGPLVLLSMILPNDTHDINVLIPLIQKLKEMKDLKIEYLVGDLGYFSAEDQYEALVDYDVAVVTELKQNTIIPDHCSPEGKPECSEGYPLIWDGFDRETYTSWFVGDETKCPSCPLQGTCDKQFEYDFGQNPFLYGAVPQASELQEKMLQFRKQVELAFAQESNQLDSVMKHKKIPIRTTERVQSFYILNDIFRLIQRMIKHVRATILPPDYVEKLQAMQLQQVKQTALPSAA